MSFIQKNGFLAAAFLLSVGVAGVGFGQQGAESEGIVRITDGRARTASRQGNGQQVTPVSAFGHHYGQAGASSFDGCPTGNCPTGGCPSGAACQGGNCPHCRGGCLSSKFGEHYCKHSPDYGYSPPAKYPLHRRGVEYDRYYPSQWYGAGADYSQSHAPMVYQPTDTTQLGFYYQHVPFWQPQPNRLPPRPVPSQWHITPPPVQASGFCRQGWGGHGGYHGRWGQSANCPTDYGVTGATPTTIYPTPANGAAPTSVAPTPITPNPAEAAPVPVEEHGSGDVPPSARIFDDGGAPNPLPAAGTPSVTPLNPNALKSSAESGHIRRLSFAAAR